MKIIIKNATKIIGGNKVLDNINMTLESGNIYGFVGENGSGKTMLIRAIAKLISLTSGKIECEKDFSIGIILENVGLYRDLSAFGNLKNLAIIRNNISNEDIKQAISDVGLDPNDKRPIRKYSLGMRQRVVLAQAVMENPDILLLDEPTNSLDDKGMEIVRSKIKLFKEENKIVVIASHNKEDVFGLCDVVYKFKDGKAFVVEEQC